MKHVDEQRLKKEILRLTGKIPVRVVRISPKSPTINFRVQFADACTMLVKCCPKEISIGKVEHRLAMRMLAGPGDLDGFAVWCFTWLEGAEKLFLTMSRSDIDAFLEDYESFRSSIAREGIGKKTGEHGNGPQKVIHGDLNRHNILFLNNRISGICDYEEFRLGFPTEDLLRFVCTSFESHSFLTLIFQKRAKENFRYLVAKSLYSGEEWRFAIGVQKARKIKKKGRLSFFHRRMYNWMENVCKSLLKDEK